MKKLAGIIFVLLLFAFSSVEVRAQYDKDVFFLRGRQALADGRYAQSIENFNILARLDTTDFWTFFYRGIAKYNLGDIRGAEGDFNTSVRLNPVFTSGYHYRAISESRLGEYDKALSDLEKALYLRPGEEGLYFSRGVTYFLSRQFDKAVADFDWYIRREPKDALAYLNRGASNLYLSDTTAALADYDKAIEIDRYEPEGYVRRARLYSDKGDYDKALSDIDKAIDIDSTSTYNYFMRALLYYYKKDYNSAMADLDRVLKEEPGNSLTLYNRSLIRAQVGDYESALADMDRVININPDNVLAYFNRASYFINMGRWQDALEDYDKAIDLYPDFAKAYMNRSYVENMMGRQRASKRDYEIAQQKVSEYREKNKEAAGSFADTTMKYSSLLSLDAEFAKKDFDNELLQNRDVDIRLRPLYRFVLANSSEEGAYAITSRYENALVDKFCLEAGVPVKIASVDSARFAGLEKIGDIIYGQTDIPPAISSFRKGAYEVAERQYNTALGYYNDAIFAAEASSDKYQRAYGAFYLLNRAVLRAEMIDFISSVESNVQTLSMDDQGTTRARVQDKVTKTYDYSDAISDLDKALQMVKDNPYIYYDMGNLRVLSTDMVEAISDYDKAVGLYPYFGDAYFNRGLVLIYLKDKEKGCIDLSRAGELGVSDAYSVISKYCETDENQR
jgi:tetratricopeptide (TPR) repeat protein